MTRHDKRNVYNMTDDSAGDPFAPSTRTAFLQFVQDNPNSRRVSQAERQNLIDWLTDQRAPPSSQKEFSRRNYVRKTFALDANGQMLVAIAKKDGEKDRKVITEDNILDVVELVHTSIGHAGWDATWKEISNSYNGILRADVTFLLKRCSICVRDPRMRPKECAQTVPSYCHPVDDNIPNLLNIDSLFYDDSSSAVPQDEVHDDESFPDLEQMIYGVANWHLSRI